MICKVVTNSTEHDSSLHVSDTEDREVEHLQREALCVLLSQDAVKGKENLYMW